MMTTAEIRDLITKGKLKDAIDAMIELSGASDDGDLQNSLILQSSRYQENERSNLSGIISSGDYSRSRARITYALLSYLDEMKDVEGAAPVTTTTTGDSSENNGVAPPPSDITKILFLASNPTGTAKLQLDKEYGRIFYKLQNSPNFNRFQLKPKKAVTLSEFLEYLLQEAPDIVHFSGHGERNNSEVKDIVSRGLDLPEENIPVDDTGIILYDEDSREPLFVGTSVIQHMFNTMINDQGVPIKVVIFNNCYSQAQAEAIAKCVPNVIGTSWSVKDNAAIAFATGFYIGLANDRSVKASVQLGITNAMAYGEPKDKFILFQNGERVIF